MAARRVRWKLVSYEEGRAWEEQNIIQNSFGFPLLYNNFNWEVWDGNRTNLKFVFILFCLLPSYLVIRLICCSFYVVFLFQICLHFYFFRLFYFNVFIFPLLWASFCLVWYRVIKSQFLTFVICHSDSFKPISLSADTNLLQSSEKNK